ncbi:MAG: tape measure protein [Bacteroides sp.]|nr:tape measure protein [Bacteroides sp.]
MRDRLTPGLDKAGKKVDELTEKANRANAGMRQLGDAAQLVGSAVSRLAAAFTLKEVISNVTRVRGEFQKLEVAFTTMLGSADKAEALMSQLVQTAAITPFGMSDIANSAKQLLAYGVEADKVNETLIRLGDIAAGLSIPINDLAYLYGTTMVQGRMYTQDLNQFLGRGIPLTKELAAQFGVAESKVKSLVEEGRVGFPELEKAIISLTDEGGQFGGLMMEQSKTIAGQLSNIEDAVETMMNEIGKSNEGLINDVLSGVSFLVENYRSVGQAIQDIVVVYGSYRAAVILVSAAQSAHMAILRQAVVEKRLAVAAGIALSNSEAIATAQTKLLTIAQRSLLKTLRSVKAAMATNPYTLAALAITGVVYGLYKFATAETIAERTIRTANEQLAAHKNHYNELEDTVSGLVSAITSETAATSQKIEKLKELQRLMPGLFGDMDLEAVKRANLTELLKKSNEELERQRLIGAKVKLVQAQQKLTGINNRITLTQNKGGYTGPLKEQRKAAQEAVALWQKTVDDIVTAQKEAQKAEAKTATVQDKSYWEKKKKEAENARDALDVSKVNSKEWKEYTKQIQEAETQLAKYGSPSKQEKSEEKEENKERKAQEKVAEQTLSLRRETQQAEIDLMKDGTKKKLAQVELDYQQEIDAIKKQRKEWEDAQGGTLTDEQTTLLGTRAQGAAQSREKGIADAWKERTDAEKEAMNAYLREYGTFYEKRQAITEDYNRQIAAADTEGEKLSLQKQMEEALANVDMEQLKQGINWELIFSDLDNVAKTTLEKVRGQLEQFMKSAEYQNMTVDQKKVVNDALNSIRTTIADKGGLLGDLPEQVAALTTAQKKLRTAQGELTAAQNEYNEALKNGTEDEKKAASKKLENAQNKKNDAEKNQQNQQQKVEQSSSAATSKVATLADAIGQLGSSSEMSLAQVGQVASQIVEIFSQSGDKVSGIIAAVFSLLDVISKQGIDSFLGNVISSIANAAASIWNTVFGWSGLDFGGESDPHLAEDIEALTASNQSLQNAIDRLSDKMDDATLVESTSIYNQQVADLQQSMKNTQEMMARSGAAYSNGFLGIGGSHSSNNKIDNAMTATEWAQISEIVGRTIDSAGDFWSLSSEEMWKVADQAYSIYAKIQQYADDGHENAAQYMDEYIEYYEQLQELQDAYREKLTSYSFDDIESEFKNVLLDMEADAEDFAESFEEMMQQAVINSMMSNTYSAKLREWYEDFATALESGGEMTNAEQEALRQQYQDIVDAALAERDALMETMGWDGSSSSSQSASTGSFDAMTQDQGTKLEGMFTSGLQHWSSMDSRLEDVSAKMDTAEGHLARIAENTGASATHLSEIKESILKIIRDGLKVK